HRHGITQAIESAFGNQFHRRVHSVILIMTGHSLLLSSLTSNQFQRKDSGWPVLESVAALGRLAGPGQRIPSSIRPTAIYRKNITLPSGHHTDRSCGLSCPGVG